ncbi:MAG: TIGR01777 family protein [Ignavibacteriae bacterium]|nr:TIGR01777 family protein [Ignavibacteriota bacterium]
MDKRIVISGGTGLIGKKIISRLKYKGYSVTILTRNKRPAEKIISQDIESVEWDYSKPTELLTEIISGCEAVINLAGASIAGRRWNHEYKKLIYDSRVLTTQKISEAISLCKEKPLSFVSASASGYYGFDGEEQLTEDSTAGSDFLAKVCKDWERAAYEAERSGVRTVTVRIAVVLDKNEGALKKLIAPFKFFLGGHLGSGKQWFPWIHADDLADLFLFSIENKNIRRALNGSAPEQIRNKEFCKILGKIIGRPSILPVPGFMLRLITGEFAKYLLKGRRLVPEKALNSGFIFKYDTCEKALKNILDK